MYDEFENMVSEKIRNKIFNNCIIKKKGGMSILDELICIVYINFCYFVRISNTYGAYYLIPTISKHFSNFTFFMRSQYYFFKKKKNRKNYRSFNKNIHEIYQLSLYHKTHEM